MQLCTFLGFYNGFAGAGPGCSHNAPDRITSTVSQGADSQSPLDLAREVLAAGGMVQSVFAKRKRIHAAERTRREGLALAGEMCAEICK